MMNYISIAALAFSGASAYLHLSEECMACFGGAEGVVCDWNACNRRLTDIVDDDSTDCQPGMLGCDSNTWAPTLFKQCEVGVKGCNPNTYSPTNNGPRKHIPVCYYVPADDGTYVGDSDSWAPVFVELDEENGGDNKVIYAINRETIIVRIAQQDGFNNFSFDAPTQDGALLLDDSVDQGVLSDTGYYHWVFKVKGCMTREQLNFTGKAAAVNGTT